MIHWVTFRYWFCGALGLVFAGLVGETEILVGWGLRFDEFGFGSWADSSDVVSKIVQRIGTLVCMNLIMFFCSGGV